MYKLTDDWQSGGFFSSGSWDGSVPHFARKMKELEFNFANEKLTSHNPAMSQMRLSMRAVDIISGSREYAAPTAGAGDARRSMPHRVQPAAAFSQMSL